MDDRDVALAEITRRARAARPRPSRTLWIIAGIVGFACAIGFVIMLVSDASTTPGAKPVPADRGLGFTAGLVIGAVVGVVIGFAVARRGAPDQGHSSRNKP